LTGLPKDAIINTYTNTLGAEMTTKAAMFVFITGLIMTFGAVGGIEVSESNTDMMSSMVIAIIGLLTMYAGTLGLRNAHYFD
jgi:hypothetical protein